MKKEELKGYIEMLESDLADTEPGTDEAFDYERKIRKAREELKQMEIEEKAAQVKTAVMVMQAIEVAHKQYVDAKLRYEEAKKAATVFCPVKIGDVITITRSEYNGKKMRVEEIKTCHDYYQSNNSHHYMFILSGRILKKDGTDSAHRHSFYHFLPKNQI